MKAVRFGEYGGVEVLQVADVPEPAPGPGQVLVRVRATGINPGEAKIRAGLLHDRWPAVFPSGQGSDLAGIAARTGPGVAGVGVGAEVIGFTHSRASQAEYVLVEAQDLTAKPAAVPWEVAGSLFVAGSTAWATVRAVGLGDGDTVVVSGAAGGVGSIAVQLARLAGATVIGLASQAHHEWLAGTGGFRWPMATARLTGSGRPPTGWTRSSTRSAKTTCSWHWTSGWSRHRWTPSSISGPSNSTESRPRAAPPGPARRC